MIKHPKYPRGNIYLSGGMEHAKNLGAEWRLVVGDALREHGYFPLDITSLDKAYAAEHGELYSDFGDGERGELLRKANIRKHFVFTDLQLIKNDTDAIILYYDESVRKGAGTISEAQYAYLHDIPVFVVSAWDDWKKEVPGWLHALSTKIFTSFDDCINYLINLPDGILKRDLYGNHHGGEYYLCSLSGEPFLKRKHHFVSKVSPLYSRESVRIVKEVHEDKKDRYQFFVEYLEKQAISEIKDTD
jgi:hypothetical protein